MAARLSRGGREPSARFLTGVCAPWHSSVVKFSDKYGYTQPRSIAQVESMDGDLRTAIWNVLYARYFISWDAWYASNAGILIPTLWINHLNRDLVNMPESPSPAGNAIKKIVSEGEWYEVYNLLQAIVENDASAELRKVLNHTLDNHLAGYRVVGNEVTPLTNADEIAEVAAAKENTSKYAGARHSLDRALTLYSNLAKPDYANSIKESISAVESVARALTGKKTLGDALDQLKVDRPEIHAALIRGWKALYGYASDEDAIRHGGENAPRVNQALARYFLVTCSAFVNLLIAAES